MVLLSGLARLKADALDTVASACARACTVVNESRGHLVYEVARMEMENEYEEWVFE